MERVRLAPAVVLPVAAVIGAAFHGPSIGAGFTLADLAVAAMVLVWLPTTRQGRPHGVLAPVVVPLALILLGSLLGALAVGIEAWIVRDLAKDLGAFASFLAMIAVLREGGPRALHAVGWVAAASAVAVAALVLLDPSLRGQAGFPNPNVAAHFLGANLIVLARSPVPRWLRVLGVAASTAGLIAAGSFGALLMIVGAFAYLGFSSSFAKRRPVLRVVVPLVLILGFGVVMTNLPEDTQGTGFNTSHLERSSTGRFVRWEATVEVAVANPTGLGPGSNRGLGLLPHGQEAHNEYLAYLTERGVIGLVGLVALFAAIWRLSGTGSLTRALIIAYALQGLVRETTHYRHLWLLLAFAVVLDTRERWRTQADDAVSAAVGP